MLSPVHPIGCTLQRPPRGDGVCTLPSSAAEAIRNPGVQLRPSHMASAVTGGISACLSSAHVLLGSLRLLPEISWYQVPSSSGRNASSPKGPGHRASEQVFSQHLPCGHLQPAPGSRGKDGSAQDDQEVWRARSLELGAEEGTREGPGTWLPPPGTFSWHPHQKLFLLLSPHTAQSRCGPGPVSALFLPGGFSHSQPHDHFMTTTSLHSWLLLPAL